MADRERLRIATDSFEEEHMASEGDVLLRDKLTSRALAALMGVLALVTFGLGFTLLGTEGVLVASLGPWLASAVLAFCALTLSVLRTVVSSQEVLVRYGLWGPRVAIGDVISARVVDYSAVKYGGWGIKRGIDGSWAYTMPSGTSRVVEMVYRDGAKEKKVVFSASRPDAVVAAIERAQSGGGVRIAVEDEVDQDEAALQEALAEEEALEADVSG